LTRAASLTLLVAAGLLLAPGASAQHDHITLYVTSSTVHAGNVDRGYANDNDTGAADPEQYASFFASGLGAGLTIHLFNAGPVAIGFDLRGSGTGGYQNEGSGLGGVQLALRTRPHGLRPYVQYSYGIFVTAAIDADPYYGSRSCLCNVMGVSQRDGAYHGYQVFVGADYRLTRLIDLRAIELGLGSAHGNSPDGGPPLAAMTPFNLATGLTVHF